MIKTITIITQRFPGRSMRRSFLIGLLMKAWKSMGLQVQMATRCQYLPADLAILHVDATRVDKKYLDLAARYPIALNIGVTDIAKSTFSRVLVEPGDAWSGPVIVKTDANYGGFPEKRQELLSRGWRVLGDLATLRRDLSLPDGRKRTWRDVEYLDSMTYPVFGSPEDVPDAIWQNSNLVVERFLPERLKSGEYKTRSCLFFGDQELGIWSASPEPINKVRNATKRGLLESTPEQVRRLRREAGFDFGRFDYTIFDGEIHVFDMNKTPFVGDSTRNALQGKWVLDFAREIFQFDRA